MYYCFHREVDNFQLKFYNKVNSIRNIHEVTLTAYLRPFLCITFSLFFTSSLSSQRLVTINKDVITTTEFQQYINLQKASAGKKNADIRDLLGNEDEINDLLEKYIDQRIILTEAAKKGYNSKNKAINEIFNEQKDMLVAQLFLADKKEFSDISVSEDEISAFYEKVKKRSIHQVPTARAAGQTAASSGSTFTKV